MPHVTKRFIIKAREFLHAGEVSMEIQGLLKTVGFSAEIVRRVAICAYESEMNVVMHGCDGELTLTMDPDSIAIEVGDKGPGIEDIELALQEGYSTATKEFQEMGFGAGMGLPNIRKNADTFEIRSQKGEGTHLRMCFWLNRSDGKSTGK